MFFLIVCSAGAQIVDPFYYYGSSHYESGKKWFDEGILPKSESDILKVLKRLPESPAWDKAYLLRSEIDLNSGNYTLAEAQLSEFNTLRPNSPFLAPANLVRAYLALRQKDYVRSATLFDFTKKIAEQEFRLREDSLYYQIAHISTFWKGISLAQHGNYQDAIPVFEDCLLNYPDGEYTDDAIYALGQSEEVNNRYNEAISYFDLIIRNYQRTNSFVAACIRQANNKLVLREYSAAITTLEKADIALDRIQAKDSVGMLYETQTYSDNAREEIHYLRGEAYNLSGNYDQAINTFRAFLGTFTESVIKNNVKLGVGWALLHKGEYESGIQYFDEIIAEGGSSDDYMRIKAIAQLYRTVGLKLKGDTEQAQKELSALAVQTTYPYLSHVLLELGQLYYEKGEFDQARKTLERAERESASGTTSVRIELLLGASNMELKRWEQAITAYSSAIQLAQKSSEIFMPDKKWYLAEAYLKQGISLVQVHRSSEAIPSLLSYIGGDTEKERADEAIFWLAEAYYKSDLFKNAVEMYSALLEKFPKSIRREESLYGLGWSYLRQKEFKSSSATFDKLIKEYPNSEFGVEALSRQGDGYFYTKNFKLAAQSYDRAKRLAPNSENGQYSAYQLCHAYYRMGEYDDAITALMDFVKRYPSSPYAPNSLYLIGWIRFQQKRFTEAIDNFKFLTNAYPQSELIPRAHYAIADALYNMSNYEGAMQSYKVVIESFPSSELAPEAMKGVQYCLVALGREDEAILDIDSYINANPSSPFATDFKFKKAELFYSGRKHKDAITEYESIIAKDPDSERNAEAFYWMLKSYINLNDSENSEQTFRRLQAKYPKSEFTPLGMLELGLMKKRLNEPDKADSLFALMQTNYPDHQSAPQAGFERALIKYSLGDTLSAMKLFRDIATKYPGKEYAQQSRWRIAMYYRGLGMNDSARTEFAILAVNEDDKLLAAESQYRIGELWMRDKNTDAAIDAFVKVKESFAGYEDWYSLSLLNAGECHEEKLDFINAREVYEILETLRPDDDFGKTAKRRLKRLPKE
jgi:TolA-binding protein